MICIYDSGNENFNNNGDAVLLPTECLFAPTINRAWVVTLTHPYDAKERYKHIAEDAVLRISGLSRAVRFLDDDTLYRIASVKKGIDSVVAVAYPIAMDATFEVPIASFTSYGDGMAVGVDLDELTNKYNIFVDLEGDSKHVHFEDTNLNQVMGGDENSMLTIFGGELYYNNYNFEIKEKIGNQDENDRHVIRYGKNLNNIDYTRDESGVITRIYPISKDGIKLNGSGYVDSSHISDYPFVRAKYLSAPYQLVDTSKGSTTNTATLTASIATQVKNTAETLSHTIYNTAVNARTFEREYLKENREEIIEAVQELCLQGISHEGLYGVIEKAIADGMKWMKDIQKLSWTWHQGQNGWWYGTDNSDYAKSQWCYIDKKWRWFDADGYWVEKWDDASGDWDWIQSQTNAHWWYGNNSRYYAHNEWIYQTNDGVFKKYWIDEQGWYQPDKTEESDWVWHEWGNGWWFGEEGATTEQPTKFAHDMWVWIDGNYYFFDSTGYYDGTTKIDNYAWDWQEDNGWYWFGNRDKSFGSQWLYSQWSKIDNKWYRFDANGYMADDKPLLDECLAMYRTGMADLKTLCGNLKNEAYTLLYTNMTNWCNKRYSEGLDMPTVTINLDMIDLSKSLEYYKKGYSWLEDVQLGDKVRCEDREHDIYTYERVVGITYDCIRKMNTQITIGVPESTVAEKLGVANGSPQPTGGYDMSIIEGEIDDIQDDIASLQTNKQNKLIAGENITITDGNVISATGGVVPNPVGTATETLNTILINGVIYRVGGGVTTAVNTRLMLPSGNRSVSEEGSVIL